MAKSEFESSDNTQSDAVDSDLLGIEVFSPGQFIHILLPEYLFDLVVQNLVDHLPPVFSARAVINAEGLCELNDDIKLVGSGVKEELTFDVEGNC